MSRPAPSWIFGFRRAAGLGRLVLAVFLFSAVVFLPAHVILRATVGGALGSLPDSDLPDGEVLLIVSELVRPMWPALAVAVICGWCAQWAWTVLWHAGSVRWMLDAGRTEARLGEILGYGLIGWWRWARLGLTSLAVLVIGHGALVVVVDRLRRRSVETGDDSMAGIIVLVAVAVSAVLVVVCWLATLRGAWVLGGADRRSAVLAWLAGLKGALVQPVRSLTVLVLWLVPALAASALPLVAGWQVEALRATLPNAIISAAGGLAAAFCWVGLFVSFAPVSGLAAVGAGESETDRPVVETGARQPREP